MRARDHDAHDGAPEPMHGAGLELPPGATFDPDPQASLNALPRQDKYAP
jgi:putative (di)nucleoside polyphosphate hydrolase